MGLGLLICRSIVEAHGGRIWASRNAGPGATVQFTLSVGKGCNVKLRLSSIFTGVATWSSGSLTRIKHCRRVETRYDKLAANYLAFVGVGQYVCGCGSKKPRHSFFDLRRASITEIF